jgi:hypothetical protein
MIMAVVSQSGDPATWPRVADTIMPPSNKPSVIDLTPSDPANE